MSKPDQTSALARSEGLRYELVLESAPKRRSPWSGLLAGLSALSERSGSAFGEAYARAAGAVLTKQEQLEDRAAERRYQQRLRAHAQPRTSDPSKPTRS